MANTYSQIYIQIVFSVKFRQNLIDESWEEKLYKYISGIIKGKGHKPIIVNGMPDHVHIFVGLKPSISISELVRDIKNNSSKYVNEQNLCSGKFQWQNGFGAFSYSKSHIDRVYRYIENQKEHHKKSTFKAEYYQLLQEHQINFEEKYLFDWIE